jgi:hypothetical protein
MLYGVDRHVFTIPKCMKNLTATVDSFSFTKGQDGSCTRLCRLSIDAVGD